MNSIFRPFTALSLMILLLNITAFADDSKATFTISVSAGELDRNHTVVTFSFPDEIPPGNYYMTSESGERVAVQVDIQHTATFVLKQLSAGETESFTFKGDPIRTRAALPAGVSEKERTLSFTAEGREVLEFYHKENNPPEELDERYKRGGYIHPVRTPSGTILTSHLDVEGHPHHSGIWSAWTNTEFQGRTPDFWNVHHNSGRVDLDTLLSSWSGAVHSGFESVNRFIDLSADEPVTALLEHWRMKVYSIPGNSRYHLFDLNITQTVHADAPLLLPEYRYGGIGFRGHPDWTDEETTTFLTSDGLGRDGHGTRARWCHIGGYTGGELGGIAILGHPENYRFPQTMRIHPSDPFFNFAPMQLGDMSVEPGKPYVSNLRFITYDGEPDAELIERIWQDYAYPPGVTVVREN